MSRHFLRFLTWSVALLCCPLAGELNAQQVDCTVHVNIESVPTTNKDQLRDFGSDVRDYVNNYQWGTENIPDKVKCTLDILIQRVTGDNKYTAQVFIGSQRPIYGSNRSSVVLRLFDENWEFTYVKGRPLNHNPYSFTDLTSFLDFYMYMIVGYDSDTFERLSGTPMFQKAADIANMGRSSSQSGWAPATTGYSRLQLNEDVLNPKFEPVRTASWMYHFTGLDSLAFAPDRATQNILQAIDMIGKVKQISDPRNQIIKVFFDTKYMEIADLFANYPDRNVYIKFGNIDPAHQQTYEEYRQKK